MLESLFFLDKLILAKLVGLYTPYNLFIGGTFAYLFATCCVQLKKSKEKVK